MQFCAVHKRDLSQALSSLPRNRSDDPTRNPPVTAPFLRPRGGSHKGSTHKNETDSSHRAEAELSVILLSLRKLREAVLATHPLISFQRQVHFFCVRLALHAAHPPSYYPPLVRLLRDLNTPSNPLDPKSLKEFTTYLILDYACRQDNLQEAYNLRAQSKEEFQYHSSIVDNVLNALTHDNWVLFWKTRKEADGYMKQLLNWATDVVRHKALRAVGRAYMMADVDFIMHSCAGETRDCNWGEFAEKEELGWKLEGNKVMIKMRKATKPKT